MCVCVFPVKEGFPILRGLPYFVRKGFVYFERFPLLLPNQKTYSVPPFGAEGRVEGWAPLFDLGYLQVDAAGLFGVPSVNSGGGVQHMGSYQNTSSVSFILFLLEKLTGVRKTRPCLTELAWTLQSLHSIFAFPTPFSFLGRRTVGNPHLLNKKVSGDSARRYGASDSSKRHEAMALAIISKNLQVRKRIWGVF